jgi:predicted branched-subunit amino acid permease
MSAPPDDPAIPSDGTALTAFLRGLRVAATSVFAMVITVTYLGYGALAHDYGLSVGWAALSTVLLWAGPAQVILLTAYGAGTPAIETAVAVGLSSVRLLPMVVALLPTVRDENTRWYQLLFTVHFWAVAVWVEATRFAPSIARLHRVAFCNGLGVGLVAAGTIATVVGYYVQSALPVLFGAAAMFVTPLSFLISSARNARIMLEKAALGFGLVIGAILTFHRVEFDLLWTGIVGGTLAYLVHRIHRTRGAAP